MKETAAVLIDGPRRPAVTLAATGERALSNDPRCCWGTRTTPSPKINCHPPRNTQI